MMDPQRPAPSNVLSGTELRRWYWLKGELAELARHLGIRASGSKELLAARITARLDGEPFAEPASPKRVGQAHLSGPLTAATVIPRGQRCSQAVRAWFVEQTGDGFRFDAAMRAFFAETDGTQTLQDALDHHRATRDQHSREIDAQFEYNRFTRAWHATHPGGSREDLLAAWRTYRARPVDERGRA
ncbi:DUF6434 domain-containing protein [Nocardioides yefusunii]|uniref:DUF6434 domain-containing protein n=1 Tax=Nocardioides yefusunii TaxID=2500546 RepID=A0ABW1QVY0_9ACTN|nr:DUF6434 domain-containing protein [Nocardioides yefusunii]